MLETITAQVASGSVADFHRTRTLGITVDATSDTTSVLDAVARNLAARTPYLVTFVNPSSCAVATSRPGYADRLAAFDAVLPDGSGLSLAVRLIHRIPAARISFDTTSLAPKLLGLAEQLGHTVALVGGEPGSADQAMQRLADAFPMLRLTGAFHGYGDTELRTQQLVELDPDIVICGMGSDHQEKMLLALKSAGWTGCGFTCGGYLDQLNDGMDYYPGWIDRLNLRWAYRLAKEPRRLWRRYLLDYPPFVMAVVLAACQMSLRRTVDRFTKIRPSQSVELPSRDAIGTGAIP